MRGYSLDLRLKVLAAVDRGMPRKEVVRTFAVSMPTLERYLNIRKQTGEIGPPRTPGRTPFGATIEERSALWRQLEENDGATLKRHCELWEIEQGVRISVPTMWRAVRRLGWKKKGGALGAALGDRRKAGDGREGVKHLDPRLHGPKSSGRE